MVVLRILLAVAFFAAPCVLAAWLASHVRSTIGAFFLAWLLTPVLTGVMLILSWPVLVAFSDPNSDGTGAIILPFVGIITGLGSGIAAVVLVSRRRLTQTPESVAAESR